MDLGTFTLFSNPPWRTDAQTVDEEFEQLVLADELGFDEVWLAEHNARRYGIVGDVVLMAAAVATATRRIRIGTAVTRLPLHHPLHLAENLALVDLLSGGRLDWGVGKGYDPLEFSTYGVPFEEREERWAETFAAVRQVWATGRTAIDGRFHTAPDAEYYPAPSRPGGPPVSIMCSRSDSTVVWAAERLFPVVLGQGPSWDDVAHKLDLYRETAAAAGHADDAIAATVARSWQLKQVHVADTTAAARAEYRDAFMWYYALKNNRIMFGYPAEEHPWEWFLEHRSVILGSPEDVVADLTDYRERTGMPNVICWFNCGGQPREQVARGMRLFAEEVAPALRRAPAGAT